MENKNKYYTPTIEEFHIGFPYEFRTLKEWESNITDHQTFDCYAHSLTEDLEEGRIRVKYLDSSDIESLGFTLEQWGATKGDIIMEFNIYNTQEDTIDIYCVNDLRFKGTIKNKSELQILLKQLNIQWNN